MEATPGGIDDKVVRLVVRDLPRHVTRQLDHKQLRDLRKGNYDVPAPLRKGDELVDFFEEFRRMVGELRRRQEEEIALLDRAILNLREKTSESELAELNSLRTHMRGSLE